MAYLNINGKIAESGLAALPADNGSFRYGYGLFETMLVQHGAIRLFNYHTERLYAGMVQLGLEKPLLMKQGQLEEQVLKTVTKNKLTDLCRVRLQVFAGGGGLFSKDAAKAGFVIECFPLLEEITQLNENGLVLGIAPGMYKSADSLSNLKSCNALIYAMAAGHAREAKWNDALIKNTHDRIIESTIANIFWIKDTIVYTPPLTEGCIAGVMRRHIIDTIPDIQEKELMMPELEQADEVFLTNAIRGIKWVRLIGEKKYKATITSQLH